MLGHVLVPTEKELERFEVGIIDPSIVPYFWPEIADIIEKHPVRWDEDFYGLEDIYKALCTGTAFCWVGSDDRVIELVLICCIVSYPKTNTLQVMYVGGKGYRRMFKFWPKIQRWALTQGCTHFEGKMTPGMKRLYKSLGFKNTFLYYCARIQLGAN